MPKKRFNLPKGLQNKPPGSENWYQIFYRKDRQPTIKWVRLQAHDLQGAKVERERLLRAYELGLYDPWEKKPDATQQKDPTLREAVDAYLEAHSGLAENTCRSHRSVLRMFVEENKRGRRRKLRQISAEDIERFIDGRSGLKESTRRLRLSRLVAFFGWCVKKKLCEDNPARQYKGCRSEGLSVYDRQRAAGEPKVPLMPDDVRAILGEVQADTRRGYLYDVFLFLLATGIRRSEFVHLNRRDVHIDEPLPGWTFPVTGRIRVRSWDHPTSGERFRTKTGKDRIVTLTPLATRIAARHLAAGEAHSEDSWQSLFIAPRGGRFNALYLSVQFQHFRKKAGLTDRVTLHSLRHSFASWCMMLGVNIFSIKRLLGHASLDQLDTYAEMVEEYLIGDARSLQRQMLFLLCPDLPDAAVERVLPSRRSLAAALSDERFGHVQSLHSIIPAEDVLFSGICYELTSPAWSPDSTQVAPRPKTREGMPA